MILTRQGNKSRIAHKIHRYFPPHRIYIELFFGAGGMFFNKPQAQYNFLNDIDSEVFNLWTVVKTDKDALIKELSMLPIHSDLWAAYKKERPKDKVLRAALFLLYSNFGYMGTPNTLQIAAKNQKQMILQKIEEVFTKIYEAKFLNCDFRLMLGKLHFTSEGDKNQSFIYADPPYIGTYDCGHAWTESDVVDCFNVTFLSGIRAAMSEFNHPLVLRLAADMGLNVITIGERRNMKNRKTEVLITNYKHNKTFFDI